MIIKLFDLSNQLSSIQRYSKTKLVNPESVLEHQGFVAINSYLIAMRLNELGENFDMETVIASACIHDIDERGTGDIQRPTKYSSPEMLVMLNRLAFQSVVELGDELELSHLQNVWANAKEGREGQIVSLCDGLAVLYKVWQEVVLFNNISIIDHTGPMPAMLNNKFNSVMDVCSTNSGIEFVSLMREDAFKILYGKIMHRKEQYGC